MALWILLRALFGYFVLVFIVRIVGRRPGKQLTPFEFVLIFFLGGLSLTAMVGQEVSLTNAICQIITVAAAHALLTLLRSRSAWWTKVLDATPLILMEGGYFRSRTMRNMRITAGDVMAVARDKGMKTLSEIDTAVLERNGEMSLLTKK